MRIYENLIVVKWLDPSQLYSLGNKDTYYRRQCNSGHEDLIDSEIGITGGHYDGYDWEVPYCKRCVPNSNPLVHSHNTAVHLMETSKP